MADFKNTKEGRTVARKYADILHLSRPEPPVKHPRMALSNRAKIFSPFAALRGFDDEISSEGASKLLVKKVELSDEEKNNLSDNLLQVKKGMKVVVRYFVRTTESTGKYISLTGTVVMIDPVYRELKVMQYSECLESSLPLQGWCKPRQSVWAYLRQLLLHELDLKEQPALCLGAFRLFEARP